MTDSTQRTVTAREHQFESQVHECQACGWLYPPQSEASTNNDDVPTPFSELPDSFSCPLCGVAKSEFKVIEETSIQADTTMDTAEAFTNKTSENTSTINQQQANKDNEDANNHVVIIGAGLAGWGVVDAIRAKNKEIKMTLITADNGDRYHKPMLSAAFSQNKTPEDLIRFTGEEASKTADIHLLAQTQVQHINSQKRTVQTDKGDIHYSDLVMAMGATPAMPPSLAKLYEPSKLSEDSIWHINDITNFAKIQQVLSKQAKHIAVIGAGMVGTEIAEDLTKAGHKVTLLDMNDAPLATMLPSIATAKIKEALQAQGIEFLGGCRVTEVMKTDASSDENGGYSLQFVDANNDKKILEVDHILVSTGLKVSETLPMSAGVDFDMRTGIAVDEASLQTSQPNIYAIGDCMSIGGAACRYVAPLRAQAATIAEHILGSKTDDYEHKSYQHKPPMIRLKNKSISVSATGTPTSDETHGKWRVASETTTETHHEMVLEQVADDNTIVATVTLKMPL